MYAYAGFFFMLCFVMFRLMLHPRWKLDFSAFPSLVSLIFSKLVFPLSSKD